MAVAALGATLGASAATVLRALRSSPETFTSFKLKGQRAQRYATLRPLPLRLDPRQRVYRVSSQGRVEPFADVEFLTNGGTLERKAQATTLYEGLPPYMAFAAPSGFLGNQVANALQAQPPSGAGAVPAFPASLRDWNDDHRIAYLFTQGLNLPGNLVFGEASLQKEVALQQATPITTADKLAHYGQMASALKSAAFGSSAGGEQPKFLSLVADAGHVIVKFARRGTRAAELLTLEHLALQALHNVGVPAARTQVLACEAFVFLEVARFDRQGLTGRIGMLSAGSVDDEFFGRRDTWPEFAARCVQARYLRAQDAHCIDTMAAFSELIGNNDRHFENISLLIGEDGDYLGVAPAYDILPMRYASPGGGLDPDLLPIQPRVGSIGANPAVWRQAAQAAEQFWVAAMEPGALAAWVPPAMRALAAQNLAVAQAFAAPLLRG